MSGYSNSPYSIGHWENDELGIPVGEHELTCGCKMRGRGLVTPCEEHAVICMSDLGDFSVSDPS